MLGGSLGGAWLGWRHVIRAIGRGGGGGMMDRRARVRPGEGRTGEGHKGDQPGEAANEHFSYMDWVNRRDKAHLFTAESSLCLSCIG